MLMSLQSTLFRGDPKLEAAALSDAAHIVPGAAGAHVKKIQQAVNKLSQVDLTEDGIYGPATAAAVLAYKRDRKIINFKYQTKPDNIVGKMTLAALDRELRGLADPIVVIGRRSGAIVSFAITGPPVTPTSAGVGAVIRGNPYVRANASDKDGLPPSVPPGHAYEVNISVTPSLTGNDFIDVAVINTSPLNGIAVIADKRRIRSSTTVAVLGSSQTEPGNGGKLQIQASLNGKVLAVSNGFSVCAHIRSITTQFLKTIDESAGIGMFVQETLEADSGAPSHLDQVKWHELVDPIVRDEPPFGQGSGFINNTEEYISAIPPKGQFIGDRHAEPRPSAGPKGRVLKVQVHVFKCNRCGAEDKAIPFSGYEITHEVFPDGNSFSYKVTKKPLDTSVRIPKTKTIIKARAGFGEATSPVHKLGVKAQAGGSGP
jgi:hypothetical protein